MLELKEIDTYSLEEFHELWKQITNEFKDLNQNYQSFLKKFQESKTEELLESTVFLEYKDKMVAYLEDFIQGYLTNGNKIKEIILSMDKDIEEKIVTKLETFQRQMPKINQDFNYQKFNEVNRGKYKSIYSWFVGINDKSEGERLIEITTSIIMQISKCVSSLMELHGNMIARKEEYKYICKLFDKLDDLKDCHSLSSVVFGIPSATHYKGISNNNTDSIIGSLEVDPIEIEVEKTKTRERKEKSRIIIDSKKERKKEILKRETLRIQKEKEILLKFVNLKEVNLSGIINLSKEERNYVLNLISRSHGNKNKENVLGLSYKIETLPGTCKIESDDGIFTMQSMKIIFEGEEVS